MSHKAVGELMDRWMNEPKFRQELRSNPEGTLKKSGVKLNEEEWVAFRKIDWSLSDEELKSKASNLFG